MTKKTKIIITASAALVVCLAGIGIYTVSDKTPSIVEPVPLESSSSTADVPASSDIPAISSSAAEYSIPPIPLPPKTETTNSKPEENSESTTKNPDGTTSTEISRPEWSKPEGTPPKEPAGPPKDETNPDNPNASKPEDNSSTTDEPTVENPKPESPKPSKPEPPTGGDTNHKGQFYDPVFGWQTPTGGYSEEVSNAGTGEVIGH